MDPDVATGVSVVVPVPEAAFAEPAAASMPAAPPARIEPNAAPATMVLRVRFMLLVLLTAPTTVAEGIARVAREGKSSR